MTPEQRGAVVNEALEWLGTPYHHHGRIKRVGVDCAQILLAIYPALTQARQVDPGVYPPEWHLHRGEELYVRWMIAAGARQVESPEPGDIGLFKFGRCFSHGAIYVGDNLFVHSYIGRGVILSAISEEPLSGRPVMYWTI